MSNKGRTRVVNAENVLFDLVPYGETFRVGLSFNEELIKNVDLDKYGLQKVFKEGETQLPKAAGARSRVNRKGLWARQQPEEKEEIKKHIKYTKRDGTKVEYDRIFNIYKNVLLHKLGIELSFVNHENNGPIISSPVLLNDDEEVNHKLNAHVINLYLEIFKDFEILRENYDYAFKAEEEFPDVILPEGSLSDPRIYGEFVNVVTEHSKEGEKEPFIRRLDVFKEFKATLKSSRGVNGYAVIEFEGKNIVAVESLKQGHATYFFSKKDYEETIVNDKQHVIHNTLMLKRFYHTSGWERNVRRFINKY